MILKTPDKTSEQRRIGRGPVAAAKAVTLSLCAGTRRPLFDVEGLASRPLVRIEADWGSSPISSIARLASVRLPSRRSQPSPKPPSTTTSPRSKRRWRARSLLGREFQLLGQGDRHLGADLTSVALRTVRAILDHLSEHRELYRLASSWRSVMGLIGITDLLVEQVHSFRVEFGGDHSGSGEAETTADIYRAACADGVFSAAVECAPRFDHVRIAEMLFHWCRCG
jgi:hypothetical protein